MLPKHKKNNSQAVRYLLVRVYLRTLLSENLRRIQDDNYNQSSFFKAIFQRKNTIRYDPFYEKVGRV